MESLEAIRHDLKQELKRERYLHTIGVMYTAASLAMAHGADLKQSLYAGLLHDCAKGVKPQEQVRLCEEYGIEISQTERELPHLLHAKLGAYWAQHKYGVKEGVILHAIRVHTTGEPNMSILDKILYIADFIEPHRRPIPKLDEIRKMAFHDLDRAIYMALKGILKHLRQNGGKIDPATEATYEYYKGIVGTSAV